MASTISSLTRPTTSRAVHLRITPRPSNLGESREILRLISQFGEVEYFKNLRYDTIPAPNTVLAIFREENAAQACLKRSPVRFRMTKLAGQQAQQSQPNANGSSADDPNSTIFQLSANPARASFRDQINLGHYHGSFIVDGKSAAHQDLGRRVPLSGLAAVNWRREEKPWRVMAREKLRDGAYRGSGPRKSLKDLWDEGQGREDAFTRAGL